MPDDSADGFAVRRLRPDEVGLLRDWANAEGWNPGVHDAGCFYAADPDGFFLGVLDGEPVSCISCVAYGESFGFLGFYIVRPPFRGRGLGLRTWHAGLARLTGRNVGLDGVVAQQDNYRKSGFQHAYDQLRYRAVGGGTAPAGLVSLSEVPFAEIAAYDRHCFPADRAGFLRSWLALPESVGLACVRGGRLVGFGLVRLAADAHRIGPLFADDPDAADALYRGLLAAVPGRPVDMDVPDESANPAALPVVRRYGAVEVFRTARMYTQGPPAIEVVRVYGTTSLELG